MRTPWGCIYAACILGMFQLRAEEHCSKMHFTRATFNMTEDYGVGLDCSYTPHKPKANGQKLIAAFKFFFKDLCRSRLLGAQADLSWFPQSESIANWYILTAKACGSVHFRAAVRRVEWVALLKRYIFQTRSRMTRRQRLHHL